MKEGVNIGQYLLVYRYKGPVKRFGNFYGNTDLVTEVPKDSKNPNKRALNNIAFQYKKLKGFTSSARVELDERYLVVIRETFKF